MDDSEVQSKAIIASALIVSGAIPVPSAGSALSHADGLRLCELTEHIYLLLSSDKRAEAELPRRLPPPTHPLRVPNDYDRRA
jgi:hypothetical protein